MKLERKFGKQYAQELRDETARKFWEVRELNKEQDKGTLERVRAFVLGKILKTEKFLEQEALVAGLLEIKEKDTIREDREIYNKKLDEILRNCPLTQEEKNEYLSTEAMEKMNLDNYLVLLKRLSGEAFYHVTRYGVRENTFMSTGGGHTQGEGEFVDGFIPLLKDGRINSCTSTVLASKERARSLLNKEFIEESKAKGRSVDEVVDKMMANYGTPYFLDRESAHFSYGKDFHHMYGGESDYKFYFYYPVEYILQNEFYQTTRETQITIGQGYYHNKEGINQQYNDFEIFNFGKGVPINAGILCISGDLRVDPETGSQYVLDNGKPIKDETGEFKKPEKTVSSQEYWESYFEQHPELRPSKVVYDELYTSTHEQRSDLEAWAKSKKIHAQGEEKTKEFLGYREETREQLREALREAVEEVLKEE